MWHPLQFSFNKNRSYTKEVSYISEDAILVTEDIDYEINVEKMKQAANEFFDELTAANKRINQGEKERKTEIDRLTKLNLELEKQQKNCFDAMMAVRLDCKCEIDNARVEVNRLTKLNEKLLATNTECLCEIKRQSKVIRYYNDAAIAETKAQAARAKAIAKSAEFISVEYPYRV